MSKIHSVVAALVIALVAVVSFVIELPIKVFFTVVTTVTYLIFMLLAPLTRHMKATNVTDAIIDYAWSFNFILVREMVKKYKSALL